MTGTFSYTSDPTILGTAAMSDGKVAVLSGFAGKYLPYASSSGFYYGVFDKLQVAIVSPTGSTSLSSTGLSFPSGDSPNGRPNPTGGGAIASLTSGQIAVLTWGGASGNYDVTILNSDGSVSAPAVAIGNATGNGSAAGAAPYNPVGAIAAMPGGGYVVVWNADDVQQTFMQFYNSSNQQIGSTITVADVSSAGGSTNWHGSLAVDGNGNVILGFGTADVYHNGTYKLYNSAGQITGSGTTAESESAPIFVGLSGGGFDTASYQPSGPWNPSSGYPGFNLVVQNVNTSGSISTITSVANADTTDTYAPSISNIAVNASGEVVFQEKGHAAYDTLNGSTLTRDALSPSSPGTAYSTSPGGDALSGGGEILGAAVNGTNIVGESLIAPCYCAGTKIRTAKGEVPVEALQIGDEVETLHGQMRKIKWIGRRAYDGRFIAGQHLRLPVCISRDAIADNVPSRDLWVSPGHAIFIADHLIPAWRLLNGVTITQAQSVERVEYFHVELDTHEVIFAENCPAESFLDDGCRGQFQNAGEFAHLYGGAMPGCGRTRTESGFVLDHIQRRLARRARRRVKEDGPMRGFLDLAGPELVAGWAQGLEAPEAPVRLDICVAGRRVARVLANKYRADLRQAGLGSGCHAFEWRVPKRMTGPFEVHRSCDGTILEKTAPALPQAAKL